MNHDALVLAALDPARLGAVEAAPLRVQIARLKDRLYGGAPRVPSLRQTANHNHIG